MYVVKLKYYVSIVHIRFNELVDKQNNNSARITAAETHIEQSPAYSVTVDLVDQAGAHNDINEEETESPNYAVVDQAGAHTNEEESLNYTVMPQGGAHNVEESPDYSVADRGGPSAADVSEQLTDSIIVTSECVAYNITTENVEREESVIYDEPFGYTSTTS